MNFRILVTFGMLLVFSTSMAETDFYLKDGSVLTGFVRKQPSTANSDLLIRADRALLCVPSTDVRSVQNQYFVPKDRLEDKWVKWADENQGWEYDSEDQQGLAFCDVSFVGKLPDSLKNVHLLSQGTLYEFVVLDPEDFTISSSDVQKKVMTPRTQGAVSGTTSEYMIDLGSGNGTERVCGQLVEVGPNKTYTVLTPDGKRRTFPKSSIITETILGINPSRDLLEQAEYIDMIEVKGFDQPKEGVIVKKDHKNRTITLHIDEGNNLMFNLSEIKSYNKRKNNSR